MYIDIETESCSVLLRSYAFHAYRTLSQNSSHYQERDCKYILPSAQSQTCLFLDPDFLRKAVTMMTATKAKNMADKLLARSVFRTSAVQDNLNHSYLYDKEAARAIKANLIKLFNY